MRLHSGNVRGAKSCRSLRLIRDSGLRWAADAMLVDAPADGVRSGRMKRVQRVIEVLERGGASSLTRMIQVTEFDRTSRVRRIFSRALVFCRALELIGRRLPLGTTFHEFHLLLQYWQRPAVHAVRRLGSGWLGAHNLAPAP